MYENEQWKPIKDYPNYKISDHGRVYNTKTDQFVAQMLTGKPEYYYCNLRNGVGRKLKRVHRLVAEAFIDNPDNLPLVDHIDRNPYNNHVSNLRWTCRKGNQRNMNNNVYIGDELLIDSVQKYYEDSDINYKTAYTSIIKYIQNGMTVEESFKQYDVIAKIGRKQRKVEWLGKEQYLYNICDDFKLDYDECSRKLSQGWDMWNIVYNTPISHPNSYEQDGYWFPNREDYNSYLKDIHEQEKYQNARKYTIWWDYEIITGTMKELMKITRLDEKSILWRDGKLEPPTRLIKLQINGVTKRKADWCKHFNVDPIQVNNYKYKNQCTYQEALEHFGVDLYNRRVVEC